MTKFHVVHEALANIYIQIVGKKGWFNEFEIAKRDLLDQHGWDEKTFERERAKLIETLDLDPAYGPNADLF